MRVRPYYLHQMDVAEGLEHLRTPMRAGVEILEQLRGFTTGLAVPHLAVDLPGGGGKVTLQPDYVVERDALDGFARLATEQPLRSDSRSLRASPSIRKHPRTERRCWPSSTSSRTGA